MTLLDYNHLCFYESTRKKYVLAVTDCGSGCKMACRCWSSHDRSHASNCVIMKIKMRGRPLVATEVQEQWWMGKNENEGSTRMLFSALTFRERLKNTTVLSPLSFYVTWWHKQVLMWRIGCAVTCNRTSAV